MENIFQKQWAEPTQNREGGKVIEMEILFNEDRKCKEIKTKKYN